MNQRAGNSDLQSILQNTRLGELDLTTRPTLSPDDTVATAAAEMRNTSHGCAVICDGGRVVGIFTERDLLRYVGETGDLQTSISDVMTANPRTMTTKDSLFEAIQLMDQGGYRRLPVMDESEGEVAVVDVKDVTHFLVELFPEAVYNQAAHAQLIARHREGA